MNFVTKEPINKGWSSDKKYCVTDENGTRYCASQSNLALVMKASIPSRAGLMVMMLKK